MGFEGLEELGEPLGFLLHLRENIVFCRDLADFGQKTFGMNDHSGRSLYDRFDDNGGNSRSPFVQDAFQLQNAPKPDLIRIFWSRAAIDIGRRSKMNFKKQREI